MYNHIKKWLCCFENVNYNIVFSLLWLVWNVMCNTYNVKSSFCMLRLIWQICMTYCATDVHKSKPTAFTQDCTQRMINPATFVQGQSFQTVCLFLLKMIFHFLYLTIWFKYDFHGYIENVYCIIYLLSISILSNLIDPLWY